MPNKPEPLPPLDTEKPDTERDDREVSPTGAIRGKPAAEHGAYGLVIEDSDEAKGWSEPEIRGVTPKG
jgi:hypothetical protein